MSKSILESILNEINADVAYEKYYSAIPVESFNAIVAANGGKFDSLIRFIMDSILRDGDKANVGLELIRTLKDSTVTNNTVRCYVIEKFKKNEYDEPIDMLEDLLMCNKVGVFNEKYFYENGLIKLCEDDDFLVTCTLNYSASKHYFGGKTKWCTASDRLGNHDGWEMFISYTQHDENLDYDDYPTKASLVQILVKKTNKLFQIQLYSNGDFGQICDENDDSYEVEMLESALGVSNRSKIQTIFNTLKTSASILAKLTTQNINKESVYQNEKTKSLEKKKARLAVKIEAKTNELRQECYDYAKKKQKIITDAWDRLFSSNLLSNPEFLNQMLSIDDEYDFDNPEMTEEEIENQEKMAISNFYARTSEYELETIGRGFAILKILPFFAKMPEIAGAWERFTLPIIKYSIADYPTWSYEVKIERSAYVIVEMKDFKVLKVFKVITNNSSYEETELYYGGDTLPNEWAIVAGQEKCTIFNTINLRFYDFNGRLNGYVPFDENFYIINEKEKNNIIKAHFISKDLDEASIIYGKPDDVGRFGYCYYSEENPNTMILVHYYEKKGMVKKTPINLSKLDWSSVILYVEKNIKNEIIVMIYTDDDNFIYNFTIGKMIAENFELVMLNLSRKYVIIKKDNKQIGINWYKSEVFDV